MSETLLLGLALLLVFEGIMPFTSPAAWKATMRRLSEMSDWQIRVIGFCTLVGGMLLALFARP